MIYFMLPSVGKRGPKGERGDPGKPHPGLPGPPGIQGNSSKLECIIILYNSIQQRFQKAAHSRQNLSHYLSTLLMEVGNHVFSSHNITGASHQSVALRTCLKVYLKYLSPARPSLRKLGDGT